MDELNVGGSAFASRLGSKKVDCKAVDYLSRFL